MLPPTYAELIRYDGAVVQRDERDRITYCAIQPRDVEVIRDIWRYKFLTSTQLLELHWPGCAPRLVRKRLAKLFDAGLVERFRPITRTGGSFPWTYQLGQEGHRVLREIGLIEPRSRYDQRKIYDYRYVLHEIHLNGWALAWRRLLKERLIEWHGETEIEPPPEARKHQLRLNDDRSVEGLRNERARLVRPDAILETQRRTSDGARSFLIEYDRTRRVDKNFEKFLRYDALLCAWWWHTPLARHRDPPFVVFVCQEEHQRSTFMQAADRELTGHLWHPSDGAYRHEYVGRDQILFAVEVDMHRAHMVAWRVPHFPPGHPGRDSQVSPRKVQLPRGTRSSHEALPAAAA